MTFKKTVLLTLGVMILSAQNLYADTFSIDPSHSSVLFKVNHLGFSDLFGQFKVISGEFSIDDTQLKNSKIEVKVAADSVETFNADRDKHLRGPDFFNSKRHREIVFKSTEVSKEGDLYKVKGTLNLHGVPQPIAFDFKRGQTGLDPYKNFRTGGNAVLTLKRSDYGMKFMLGGIGDEVTLFINLEGVRKDKK